MAYGMQQLRKAGELLGQVDDKCKALLDTY